MEVQEREEFIFGNGSLDSHGNGSLDSHLNSHSTENVRHLNGRRIIDLEILNECISKSMCCIDCHGPIQLIDEKNIEGLSSSLIWRCSGCFQDISIPTSSFIKASEKFAKPRAEINILAVGAIEMIGKGFKGLDVILGHMDLPNMVHKTFDNTATFIGSYASTVVKETIKTAQLEEKSKLIALGSKMDEHNNYKGEGVTDGGWQKRSYNHNGNSLSGVGVLIGKQTGKILDSEVLSVQCKVCEVAKRKKLEVKSHNCTALWTKSTKAMESEIAVRMWNRSEEYGIHFDTQIGDEDSTTQSRLQNDVATHLQPTNKKSDFLHIKRNFCNHLFKLKPSYKKILSKAIIMKLVGDFGTVLKSNIGNIDKIKLGLENLISHNYGEHQNCGEWCKTKSDLNHITKLPHGKYLDNKELRKDLESTISTFTSPETLSKIADCSSSQGAEQAFSMLSKLAPKDLYLSSSSTLQRRVNYMVTNFNEGSGYSNLIWKKIGIKNGNYRSKSYVRWQTRQIKLKKYKQIEAFKIRRKVLKHQRSARTKTLQKSETTQYKSGMGLNQIDNKKINHKRKRKSGKELMEAKKFKCDQNNCDKSYVNKSGLKQHQNSKHK
jgi:hypothetical protein